MEKPCGKYFVQLKTLPKTSLSAILFTVRFILQANILEISDGVTYIKSRQLQYQISVIFMFLVSSFCGIYCMSFFL